MGRKIAIIGSRGIPAKYGGFETFVEEIGARLVEMGNDILVSCESGTLEEYRGMKLAYFPVPHFYRAAYEVLYDAYFLVRASMACDLVYVLGIGAAFAFFIPALFGKAVLVNPDGMEWKRRKFNRAARWLLYLDSLFAARFSDVIVADSARMREYYERKGCREAVFIPYGVSAPAPGRRDAAPFSGAGIDLAANGYYLAVARLEPENSIDVIVRGFAGSRSRRKLVVVGDFTSPGYRRHVDGILRQAGIGDRVVFTGAIYEKGRLDALRQNCFAYFHGHSVGGTNPSLLEAMAAGSLVIAHDNPFNREVGGDCLLYFESENSISGIVANIEQDYGRYARLKGDASARASGLYSWDSVASAYCELFDRLSDARASPGRR